MIVEEPEESVAVSEMLPPADSNLGRVITTINEVLRSFNQEPIQHIDKGNA
jgi:hypothetical protein